MDAVNRHGLGFVRRPTGGRGVLHEHELTYSVIVSEEYPDMPETVTEAYRVISGGVLRGSAISDSMPVFLFQKRGAER